MSWEDYKKQREKKKKKGIEEDVSVKAGPVQNPSQVQEKNYKSVSTWDTALARNNNIRLASNDETKNAVEITRYDIDAWHQANTFNNIMEKGTTAEKINAILGHFGESIIGGAKQTVGGLANIGTTLGASVVKGASLIANDKEKERLNKWYDNILEAGKEANDKATYFNKINSRINNNAVRNVTGATNTVANIVTNAILTAGTGGGTVLQGLQVGGSSSQEVLNENKDNIGQAIGTGTLKGLTSYLTEKMFDANILTKSASKSSIQQVVNKTIESKIKSQMGRKIADKFIGIAGENIEEFVEDNVGNVIDKLINNKDFPGFKEWLNNTSETVKATTLSTIILNSIGLGGNNYNDIENDLKAQNASNEDIKNADYWINKAQQIINESSNDKVISQENKMPQNQISQAENDIKTQTKNNLAKVRQFYDENTFNQMQQFIETAPSEKALNQINEDIKTETKNRLEQVYKSERFTESQERKRTFAKYQREKNTNGIQYNSDVVNKALDTVSANRNGRRTVGQWKQVAEQIGLEASNLPKTEIDDIAYGSWFDLEPTKNITKYDNRTKEHKGFEKFTSDDWINTIYESAKGQKLQQLDRALTTEQYSLSEETPQNNFKYEQSNNAKVDTFRQNASKYWDNSEKTTKLVNTIEKVINDKGYNIRLDDTLGENVNGKIVTNNETGEIEITLNPNSSRTGEFILGHELTHAIQTQEMVDLVNQRMQKDGNLKNAVEDLKKLYNTDEINAEVLADISGQLFGNQEFINNLSIEKPNVFKRIYDKIISLANKITGNSNEALFIRDLRNKWEKAYRENNNNIREEQYSIDIPQNVKEIKNTHTFLKNAIQNETNQYWVEQLKEAERSNYVDWTRRESPLKWRRGIIQQYLDYKNSTSSRNTSILQQDNEGRLLTKEQQARYKDVSNELKDENGNLKNYYHGTKRADRVGNIFDPNKATSGPMAFFTDNQDIAKSYSENKEDTSLSREYDTEYDLFKVNNQSLDEYWDSLSKEQQRKINQEGYNIGLDDDFENIVHEKDASRNSFSTQYEYYLKNEENNNGIKALYDVFIQDGNLMFEDMNKFVDVLKYAGIDDIEYLDPYKTDSKVYNVYLNIKNPFNTSNISQDMLKRFKEASQKAKTGESYSADMWDKSNITPQQWIDRLESDIEEGTTHAWTSIPDWVTDVLKENGYDGIVDKGGKNGGEEHQVVIPFYSNQIKNVDNINPTDNPDIRYSKQNSNWQEYLEKNYKSEGTTTDLRDIRLKQEVKLPIKQENVQQTQENTQNTKGETINWNEIERPENNQKFRKHYRSIIESNQTTAEAKAVAKELMGRDTYTPETNKGQLAQADQRIMTSSPEVELQSLLSRAMNGEKISSVDIAVGERLIQYFSKTGNKQQLQDAIQATAMAGTSAGQTVQALSMLNHQTPQGQATWIQRSVDKMNKELAKKKGGTITTDADGNLQVINKQGVDITDKVDLFNLTPEMIDKIMNSENQEQMYKNIDEVYEELGQQVPKGMLEKIDSWRYFSMLANARTHIRNMVGNLAMGKTQRIKDKLAGGIEDVVSKFNPKMERTKTLAFADKKTKDFAKQDFKNMEVQSRLELNENKYNPQSRLQNARRTFKSNAMENTLGRLFNLNDKLLSAEDGIGLKAGYQKALADYITANKIDVDNITDAQLNKARNYAVQQAKEATFHQANAIASAVAQFENKNLATKLFTGAVLPFKKTPMNVAKAGMEYSPLQIAKSATVDLVNLRKGNISVNQYIDNLSKGMTGTGIALIGYALANAGILKASGDDDKDKEKYDEEQGKQRYSIEIGGKTYSLDWLAPTGIPLFIGAETHKLFNQEETEKSTEKKSEEDRLNQAIKGASNLLNAGATAINPMSEMSMISGLTSALSSYNTSDNLGSLGNIMTNAGKSYVNQFFPTLMGQVARTTDKYERTTKSTATGTIGKAVDQTINQIKNKIPGLRQTLPIKTDIWGKELKQEVNLPLRTVNNFINPATVKEVSTDKVDMELNKLYEENHSSSLLPDILTKTVQLNKQTYRLSNKEYAEFTKNYGQTSHKLIENFIKTSDYNKLTQEQKETAISNIYSYAKEQNKMDYAKKVNETVKPSTLYTTMKEIEKNGGKQSEYLSYLAKTKGMSKESEKNKVLADSNYSNRTKEIIYTNGTGKDDNLYNNLLSKSHINMTEYLDYKDKVSNKVFSADKDKNGKTVTGSAKAKVINYLNNNITGVGNRLLIAGKSYALQNNEKQKLAQYINSIANTREERIEIYKQLDKNFYVRNGKVYMRVSK